MVGNSADGASGPHSRGSGDPERHFALENEGRRPLKTRQYRYCGVEKRPVPEVVMGMSHDHRPLGSRQSKSSDQTAAFLELPIERFGHDFGNTIARKNINASARTLDLS